MVADNNDIDDDDDAFFSIAFSDTRARASSSPPPISHHPPPPASLLPPLRKHARPTHPDPPHLTEDARTWRAPWLYFRRADLSVQPGQPSPVSLLSSPATATTAANLDGGVHRVSHRVNRLQFLSPRHRIARPDEAADRRQRRRGWRRVPIALDSPRRVRVFDVGTHHGDWKR